MKSWNDVLEKNTVTKTDEEVEIEKMSDKFHECACDIRCLYVDIYNKLVEDCKQLDEMLEGITGELTLEDLQRYMHILGIELFEVEGKLLGKLLKIYKLRQTYENIGINHSVDLNEDNLNNLRKKVIENLKQYVEVD